MPPSEPAEPQGRIDWPAWLALGWACTFGLLYAAMILESRGAALMQGVRRLFGGG